MEHLTFMSQLGWLFPVGVPTSVIALLPKHL